MITSCLIGLRRYIARSDRVSFVSRLFLSDASGKAWNKYPAQPYAVAGENDDEDNDDGDADDGDYNNEDDDEEDAGDDDAGDDDDADDDDEPEEIPKPAASVNKSGGSRKRSASAASAPTVASPSKANHDGPATAPLDAHPKTHAVFAASVRHKKDVPIVQAAVPILDAAPSSSSSAPMVDVVAAPPQTASTNRHVHVKIGANLLPQHAHNTSDDTSVVLQSMWRGASEQMVSIPIIYLAPFNFIE